MPPKKTKPKIRRKKDVQRIYTFLKALHKLKSDEFGVVTSYLSDEGTQELSACVRNSICSELIPEKHRNKLKQQLWANRKDIRYISKKCNSVEKRKKKLPKIGGNIGLIISAVLPILMNILGKKILGKK